MRKMKIQNPTMKTNETFDNEDSEGEQFTNGCRKLIIDNHSHFNKRAT